MAKGSTAPLLMDNEPDPDPAPARGGALTAPASVEHVAIAPMFERMASDPNVDVEKLERLMAMWERNETRQARAAFNVAMSKAQKQLRAVKADSHNEQTKSDYASYEALDKDVRPVYTKHGFGLSFDTGDGAPADHVRVVCLVTHIGGFDRLYHIDMPADGKGPKGGDVMSRTHATGSAVTYGKRYLLMMIFNLAVADRRADDDGNAASGRGKPPKPKGYDEWWQKLEVQASRGLEAFEPAWACSEGEYKTYAMNHERAAVNELKMKAAGRKR